MWKNFLIVLSLCLSVSLFLDTSKIGAGDGMALVFTIFALAVGLALYAIQPKGWSRQWPAPCVPKTSQGDRESGDQGRVAA